MRRLILLGIFATLLVPGCSEPTSSISGKVTQNGKPITAGTVVFFADNNKTYMADIASDGTYIAPAVARGPIRVAVQLPLPSVPPRPIPKTNQISPEDKKAALSDDEGKRARMTTTEADFTPPAKTVSPAYADPNTSNLAFELDTPTKTFDIELK